MQTQLNSGTCSVTQCNGKSSVNVINEVKGIERDYARTNRP
jgi:hypothetical protein